MKQANNWFKLCTTLKYFFHAPKKLVDFHKWNHNNDLYSLVEVLGHVKFQKCP